ncbi:hypothetical protein [Clostridium tagluense]|uniref:Uncharacterized protein n=1 Tax=Clostridium tagluense TaxID=360422 RepID=A0A401UST4_9CLOT|nr:hypothetical protein [Clostridium tagluense]GCD12619.1 hypothetical protein Ctaglu_42420 [Clostridium tagluense]
MDREIKKHGIYELEIPTFSGEKTIEQIIVMSNSVVYKMTGKVNYMIKNQISNGLFMVESSKIGTFISMGDKELKEKCIKELKLMFNY